MARESQIALAQPLFVVIPLSLIGLLLILRCRLGPVRDFSGTFAGRGARDLSPVGDDSLPDEFLPTADAVNQLLDRLCRTLEAERSLTADAADELYAPVAAALARRLFRPSPMARLTVRSRLLDYFHCQPTSWNNRFYA